MDGLSNCHRKPLTFFFLFVKTFGDLPGLQHPCIDYIRWEKLMIPAGYRKIYRCGLE